MSCMARSRRICSSWSSRTGDLCRKYRRIAECKTTRDIEHDVVWRAQEGDEAQIDSSPVKHTAVHDERVGLID